MGLTGRQVAGALAALGLALGIFWPSSSSHSTRALSEPGHGSSPTVDDRWSMGGCPLGYGTSDDPPRANGPDASTAHSRGRVSKRRSFTAGARVFTNASFWTGDATVPWAEAMAVTDAGRGEASRWACAS